MDVLDAPDGDDDSLRPNQIFAVSLAHSPLDPEPQAEVLAICARELLTSYGLRSLGASHPDYRPVYDGGVWERDGSYHQGTVWAWPTICAMPGWAPSARFLTLPPLTTRAVRRPRRGRWPVCWMHGGNLREFVAKLPGRTDLT